MIPGTDPLFGDRVDVQLVHFTRVVVHLLVLLLFRVDVQNFLTDFFMLIPLKVGFVDKSLEDLLLVGLLLPALPERHDVLGVGHFL